MPTAVVESERVIEKALLLDAVNALVVADVFSRMLQKVMPVVICGPCMTASKRKLLFS